MSGPALGSSALDNIAFSRLISGPDPLLVEAALAPSILQRGHERLADAEFTGKPEGNAR